MERRILWMIAVANLTAASLFVFKKVYAGSEKTYIVYTVPNIAKCGEKIAFSDETKGAKCWKWDFGDGEYSNLQHGEHIYLEPNTFNIKLTITGSFGVIKDSMKSVTVRPSGLGEPVAAIPAPATPEVPVPAAPAPKHELKKKHGTGNSNLALPDDKGSQHVED